MNAKQPQVTLIYDGGCPACRWYVAFADIERSLTRIRMINARTQHPLVIYVKQRYDLNSGFVLKVGPVFYYGEAAIHQLSLLSHPQTWRARLNYYLFSSPLWSRLLYPPLTLGRRLMLMLLRIPLIK